MKPLACILASAAMTALYAQGGAAWVLGFLLLVPWLLALDGRRSLAGTLLLAWAMTLAYTAAGFAWFGAALGRYTQAGESSGIALLLLAAPLFQPQFLAYGLVRLVAGRWYGRGVCALAAAAAWVAVEWLVPRMLGDTLGYGLYPSRLLRQAADVGGSAGLTLLLLLANEGVAAAVARHGQGWRAIAKPLALAALIPAVGGGGAGRGRWGRAPRGRRGGGGGRPAGRAGAGAPGGGGRGAGRAVARPPPPPPPPRQENRCAWG